MLAEGFIYPLGYELRFSGQAELNGQSIFNNHLLCEVGFILWNYLIIKTI